MTFGTFKDGRIMIEESNLQFMTYHDNNLQISDSSLENAGLSLKINQHHTSKMYVRQVLNLWMILAFLGGLSVALSWISGTCVSFYSPAIFERSVIRHNFKFD